MMLFFEGNLLRFGNILLIAGIPLMLGPGRVKNFFMQKKRTQATVITSLGDPLEARTTSTLFVTICFGWRRYFFSALGETKNRNSM